MTEYGKYVELKLKLLIIGGINKMRKIRDTRLWNNLSKFFSETNIYRFDVEP
jgi:hypothetical protein